MGRMLAAIAFLTVSATAPMSAAERGADHARLARWHYDQGVELMKAESWDDAAAQFEAAIAKDGLMVLGHYNLGTCRMSQKRFVEAVAAYRASRVAFERLGSQSQNDRALRERDRRDEIDKLKDSLTRVHTIKGANVEHLSMRLQERIRMLESMEYRDAGRMEVPAEIPLALGSAYYRQQRLEDAEREYREALRLNSRLGSAHNNLAVVLMLSGRIEEAEKEMGLAERAGHPVHPQFKKDLAARKAAVSR